MSEASKELIKEILLNGTPAEKQEVFAFTVNDSNDKILLKFKLFGRTCYPRYFPNKDAPFHDEMILNYIKSYKGECNGIEIAFRGAAKTTIKKLFDTFYLLNDKESYRRYIKVLTKDGKNSKQIVTDVYNLLVEVKDIYGNVFETRKDIKREETMSSFTLANGVKYSAGTVGQTQRGHVQDAYRPDYIWFDDVEDRESVSSIAITEGTIMRLDEAITGLSFDGSYQVTGNYISEMGAVQWFLDKKGINAHIVPIVDAEGNATWDRYTEEKIQKIKNEADDWFGEYMCDPSRVGDKFFNIDRIDEDMKSMRPPDKESAGVRYWGNYQPHHRYGIGLDLSDGVGADSCALALFDYTTGELVSAYDTNEMPPDLFTHDAIRVGEEFGKCIIAPEVNNTCGGIAIQTLKDNHYKKIYQREINDSVGRVISNKLGWHTNSKTKPSMFYEFLKDYNDGLITIYDERVLREMKMFTKADLKDSKNNGITRHFDLLCAVCIAWQMKDHAKIQGTGTKTFYPHMRR